jgi:UDP:flavonoid glycosyltransferase YjiC (YdhE family)
MRLYAAVREQAGLALRGAREDPLLGDAFLLRGDPALEYPGAVLPDRVHHVGPLAWEPAADRAEVEAIEAHLRRSGKPVVYVHLGRFFGGTDQWPALNAAFADGPFQGVVEQGRSTDPRPDPGADILLVRKRWMGPLIDRAGLVLTSGTSAPVLAALLRGRPLGVSPNGSEQPLLAGACVRAGVAVRIPGVPTPEPSALLASAWRDHGLRMRAGAFGRRLAAVHSAARAADVIERVAYGGERREHGYSIGRAGRAVGEGVALDTGQRGLPRLRGGARGTAGGPTGEGPAATGAAASPLGEGPAVGPGPG